MPLQNVTVMSEANTEVPIIVDGFEPSPPFETKSNVPDGSDPAGDKLKRSPSKGSVCSTSQSSEICRICHCEGDSQESLFTPCYCFGTLRFVHQSCLQQWIKSAETKSCELCKFEFIMQTKIKPLKQWKNLDMNTVERRKVICSVTFHAIAITCVIWSLYVLIHRTTEEVRSGILEWPFWTKLIVVAIGFTGGLVFMYVQFKMYYQLCRRWRTFNRIIIIQPIPDELLTDVCRKKHQLAHQQAKVLELDSDLF